MVLFLDATSLHLRPWAPDLGNLISSHSAKEANHRTQQSFVDQYRTLGKNSKGAIIRVAKWAEVGEGFVRSAPSFRSAPSKRH
jgi:hypothetical protein